MHVWSVKFHYLRSFFSPGCLLLFSAEFLASLCHSSHVFLPVSAGAQLLEQTARLQNLSDALDKLKVTSSGSNLLSFRFNKLAATK